MLITSRSGCRIHLRASAVRHHHSEAIRAEEGSCISRRRGICPYPKRPKVNKQERQRRADSAKLSGDPYLGPIELDAELFSLGALLLEFSLSCLGSSLSFLEAFFLEESFLLVLLGLLGGVVVISLCCFVFFGQVQLYRPRAQRIVPENHGSSVRPWPPRPAPACIDSRRPDDGRPSNRACRRPPRVSRK